jgi:hypothetical protein
VAWWLLVRAADPAAGLLRSAALLRGAAAGVLRAAATSGLLPARRELRSGTDRAELLREPYRLPDGGAAAYRRRLLLLERRRWPGLGADGLTLECRCFL